MATEKEFVVFRDSFDRLYRKLVNYSSFYISDTEDAKEIVQDVFLKFWEGNFDIIEMEKLSTVDSFLFTVTRNKCLDYLKHKKVVLKFQESKKDEIVRSSIHEHSLSDESSLKFLINKDVKLAIKKAINELPESIKQTFVMNRFKDMTYKEIASYLEISEKTVEYRISAALKELRSKLSPYNYMILLIMSGKDYF